MHVLPLKIPAERVRSYDDADRAIAHDVSLRSVNNGQRKQETAWHSWLLVNGLQARPLNLVLYEEVEPGCAASPIHLTQQLMVKAFNPAW